MKVKEKPGKKIQEIAATLGKPYEITVIDMEYVIYRNLGNGYDFEVSGLDNGKKSLDAILYVWNIAKGKHIVETISGIKSLEALKDCLESTALKYLSMRD